MEVESPGATPSIKLVYQSKKNDSWSSSKKWATGCKKSVERGCLCKSDLNN